MTTTKRVITFFVLGIIALLGVWYFMANHYNPKSPETNSATTVNRSTPLSQFNLTDHNGKAFNEKSFLGHWSLLFFGYMACPDICPTTLGTLRDTWKTYTEENPAPARFIFVSVSPIISPDNNLKSFLANYNPNFIGLSGPSIEIRRLSDQLGIYYTRVDDKIDHTPSLMLIDPQGRLSAVFTPPFVPQEIVKDLDLLTKS